MLKPDGDGFEPHYDPAIAVPFRARHARDGRAGEAALWRSYDAIALPDAAAARRRVRPAVARDRAGDDAARPEGAAASSSPASAMRRCWSQPEQVAGVREFLLSP